MRDPEWKSIAAEVARAVLSLTDQELGREESANLDANLIPHLATYHLNACLNASIEANAAFQPSVAICLLRQCVEALTVIDVWGKGTWGKGTGKGDGRGKGTGKGT